MDGEQDPGWTGTAAVLGGVGFVTLAAFAFTESFAGVLPVLAAYAGALLVLGRDRTRPLQRVERVDGTARGRRQSR